jgi:hypothetical protein
MAKDKIGDEPNIAVYQVTTPQCYEINESIDNPKKRYAFLTKAANALPATKQEGLMYVINQIVDYQTDGWGVAVTKTDLQKLFPNFTDLDAILSSLEEKQRVDVYANGYRPKDCENPTKKNKMTKKENAVFLAIKFLAPEKPGTFNPWTLTKYINPLSSGLWGDCGNFGVKADICETITVLAKKNLVVVVPPTRRTMRVSSHPQIDSLNSTSSALQTNLDYIPSDQALYQNQSFMIKEM